MLSLEEREREKLAQLGDRALHYDLAGGIPLPTPAGLNSDHPLSPFKRSIGLASGELHGGALGS